MGSEPSWRLKMRRAQKHLTELKEGLEPFGYPHDYLVKECWEEYDDEWQWVYRAFSQVPIDPDLAVVVGDFMFNVRSALDHVAVALVPEDREGDASFPIFTADPEEGQDAEPKRYAPTWGSWKKATQGMPADAVAILRAAQPYNVDPPDEYRALGVGPEHHVLAILKAFQDADKHRRLLAATSALVPTDWRVSSVKGSGDLSELDLGEPILGHILQNGAIAFLSEVRVDVKVEGAAEIAMRVGKDPRGPYHKLPGFPDELVRVATNILEALEPWVP